MILPRLRLAAITHSFAHEEVLSGIDLEVAPGTVTALMGESGSGKTTLGRVIAGFVSPSSGTVHLDGKLVAGNGEFLAPELRSVGVVPQEGALFSHLSVAGNVAFGLPQRTGRSGRATRAKRVQECLEMVGLSGFEDRRTYQLSGGQQQRVAVARALAPSPRLVVLDEPFSALDASLRGAVSQQVADALSHVGATALLITHDASEAFRMADSVAVLAAGRIIQSGPPSELYDKPRTLKVAQAGGATVLLNATRHGPLLSTTFGSIPQSQVGYDFGGESGILVLRPRQLRLTPRPEASFRLETIRIDGEYVQACVSDANGDRIELKSLRVSEFESSVRIGDSVSIELLSAASFLARESPA